MVARNKIVLRHLLLLVVDLLRGRQVFILLLKMLRGWTESPEVLKEDLIKHLHSDEYYKEFNFEDWSEVPILTKDKIRGNLNLKNRFNSFDSKKSTVIHTGGSTTGIPTPIIEDFVSADVSRAHFYLQLYKYGWDLSKPWVKLWGRPNTSRKRTIGLTLTNCRLFNAFDMSEAELLDLYVYCKRKDVHHLYGYANAIYHFARYCRANDFYLKFQFVLSTAELLSYDKRVYISETFDCAVYDGYACTEINSVAYDSKDNPFVINESRVLIEVVDNEDKILPYGEKGRIILTDLHKRTLPLVRYETGDIGIIDYCKENDLSVLHIKELIGRTSDVLLAKDGRSIHSTVIQFLLTHYCKSLNISLIQYQVKQNPDLSLLVRLNLGSENISITEIENHLKQKLNIEDLIVVLTVDFEKLSSGKIGYFINNRE